MKDPRASVTPAGLLRWPILFIPYTEDRGHPVDEMTCALRMSGDLLTNIIGEALDVVASDVVLIADLPAGMEAEVLGSFPGSQSASTVRVHVGQLVSGRRCPSS